MKQQIGAENISSLTSARKSFMKIFDTYSEVSNMESDRAKALTVKLANKLALPETVDAVAPGAAMPTTPGQTAANAAPTPTKAPAAPEKAAAPKT